MGKSRNFKDEFNRSFPLFAASKFGQYLEDLVTKLNALGAAVNSSTLSSPGLVIKAGSSTLAKAGSAFAAIAAGVVVTKTANTDMAALVGTLATAKSAAWAFYIDSAGTLTSSAKTADSANAAAALALLPAPPAGKAMVGFITIDNTSGSNFVGGTTALDAAGIATTYFNSVGPTPFGGVSAHTLLSAL
jgi:hypothetical protein